MRLQTKPLFRRFQKEPVRLFLTRRKIGMLPLALGQQIKIHRPMPHKRLVKLFFTNAKPRKIIEDSQHDGFVSQRFNRQSNISRKKIQRG